MTSPPSPFDPGESLARNWEVTRGIAKDVAELKTWRATVEAVSVWRRWAIPLCLSCAAGVTTVLNVLVFRHH